MYIKKIRVTVATPQNKSRCGLLGIELYTSLERSYGGRDVIQVKFETRTLIPKEFFFCGGESTKSGFD